MNQNQKKIERLKNLGYFFQKRQELGVFESPRKQGIWRNYDSADPQWIANSWEAASEHQEHFDNQD